jgi:hypothetical protein
MKIFIFILTQVVMLIDTLYLPSRSKLWCTLQLRGQIHPLFLLYPYLYFVVVTPLVPEKAIAFSVVAFLKCKLN